MFYARLKFTKLCFVLELLLFVAVVESGPVCYDCQRVPYPRDCDRVRRCGDHEECLVRQYISPSGMVWFDTGCSPLERCVGKRSLPTAKYNQYVIDNGTDVDAQEDTNGSDIVVCEQCCVGEYCNSAGCRSKPLPPLSTRGPICYSCHQQPTDDSCDVIRTCNSGEECYIDRSHGTLDVIYSTGCMPSAQCDTLNNAPMVGRRRAVGSCASGCCAADYCNQNCSSLHGHAHTIPITTQTTRLTSQPSTTVKSTSTTSAITSTTVSSTSATTSTVTTVPSTTVPSTTVPSTTVPSTTVPPTTVPSTTVSQASATSTVADINRCSSKPCRNDGTCLVLAYFIPTCVCLPGYTGFNCEFNKDDCLHVACLNGGRCIDLVNDFKCTCPQGYAGRHCETTSHKHVCENKHYHFVDQFDLCYKLYRDRKTWSSARDACKREGGDLIIFKNNEEKNFFDVLARGIYAHTGQYERRFWVGASDLSSEGNFAWLDGTGVSSAYFHPGEPNNAYDGEDCAAMTYFHTDNHTLLNDDGCDVQSEYMCQIQGIDIASGNRSCVNSDFSHVPSLHMCYKIYENDPKSWTDAKTFCESKQARLLIVEHIGIENYFINQHFYDQDNNHRYWLGGNDFDQRHQFVWTNGKPLSGGLKWNQGEPNDYLTHERCLDFTYAFGSLALNDDDCSKKLYFICEE